MARKASAQVFVPMAIDVDGAPNAYGPDDRLALDYELNAHVGAKPTGRIVGYLTKNNDGRTPLRQGTGDPFPGFYVSTSSYEDRNNDRVTDPRRYVNAAEINYTLLAAVAQKNGVRLGDFCTVHSLRTRLSVYAIVGDSGNSRGAEGSLALLQRLGYPIKDGKSGGEDDPQIVVRYFARTNPDQLFFFLQSDLETRARRLDLDIDFSVFHPGDRGKLVLDAISYVPAAVSLQLRPSLVETDKKRQREYPGHLIARGSRDSRSIKIIQRRLRDLRFTEPGIRRTILLKVDGKFGQNTINAIKQFQMHQNDLDGRPLKVDGKVGPLTWGALFGRAVSRRRSARSTSVQRHERYR